MLALKITTEISMVKLYTVLAQSRENFNHVVSIIKFINGDGRGVDTIKGLIMLKLRMLAASKLSTGKLIKYKTGYTDLVYYDGDNRYVIRYPKKRGSYPFDTVMGTKIDSNRDTLSVENGLDVTEEIKTVAGPHGNFHGIETTPVFLGYATLIFTTSKGQLIFNDNSVISF